MKIQIKELGAIKEGTIDLSKKINIFCGPNGTGKTYMAFAIYSISAIRNKSFGYSMDEKVIKQLLEKNEAIISIDTEFLWNYRISEISTIKNNLGNLFSISENKTKEFFSKTELNIIETKEEFENKILNLKYNFKFKQSGYTFIIIKECGEKFLKISIPSNTLKDENFLSYLDIVLMSRVYSLLSFYPISSSTIFPVERNSIYTFSNELSIRKNDAFDQLQAISTKKEYDLLDMFFKRSTRYPQPIRDGLEVAEDLSNIQQRNSEYYDFAEEIEKDLLKGKVIITKEGEVQFVSDKAKSIKLSFHQSSSIVKTLASLVIYLKHLAVSNDLLIIDEPELNLHPNNQVLLTRIFARLINKGLRIIISTHSDYIVREINNLIMVSYDSDDIRDLAYNAFKYKEDEKINIEDIGAYMFNFKNDTSRQVEVKPIKIDKNGFEVSTLDNTIEELNKRSDELYYTLKYGKAE